MPALEWLGLLALGGALGWLGGLLGIGGGLFAIPILALLFGLDQQHAQGTALVMVMPNVLFGLWNYAKRGGVDPALAWPLAIAALPVTLAFAHLAVHVPSALLRVAFALFLLAIAAWVGTRALQTREEDNETASTPRGHGAAVVAAAVAIGALGGMLSGLFSVGGAVFAVPLLAVLLAVPQRVAQGYGLALVAPGTVAGIAIYAYAGDVLWWPQGILMAIGGVAAVPSGVALAHRLPERNLKLCFAALMVVSAAALLVRR